MSDRKLGEDIVLVETNEITPEMIAAGQRCLEDLFDRAVPSYENLSYIPEGWAEAVYRAMQAERCSGRSR